MNKVYLRGFDRPFAVVGTPIFEDERFYVLTNGNIRRKILWANILYIEELSDLPEEAPATLTLDALIDEASKRKEKQIVARASEASVKPAVAQHKAAVAAPITPPQFSDTSDVVKIKAHFVGFKNEVVSLYVSRTAMMGSYNPALAKEIFGSQDVQSIMGDFVVSGVPKLDGENIYFETKSLSEIKSKADMAANMMSVVAKAGAQLSNKAAPTLAIDPSFSMPGSPFDRPVTFAM